VFVACTAASERLVDMEVIHGVSPGVKYGDVVRIALG
jgi:hypothetical protein